MGNRTIGFNCCAILTQTPGAIASTLLDLDRWPGFTGCGPLPGGGGIRLGA